MNQHDRHHHNRRSHLVVHYTKLKIHFNVFASAALCASCLYVIRSSSNLHPHLRGEWGQRRECPAGQNDGANALIHQLLHAEARRKAPVTQYVSCKVPRKTQNPFKQVYSQEHREDSETKWNSKHFNSIWMLISTWVNERSLQKTTLQPVACTLNQLSTPPQLTESHKVITLFLWWGWSPNVSILFFPVLAGVSVDVNLSQRDKTQTDVVIQTHEVCGGAASLPYSCSWLLMDAHLKMSCVGNHLLPSVLLWWFPTEHQLQNKRRQEELLL